MCSALWLHLDLKGAPPVLTYLEELLPWLRRKIGLDGILVEYEDQFPYGKIHSRLECIPNPESVWSRSDVDRLRHLCLKLDLALVPLVQTLGHLEFVLKHERFTDLRELPQYVECLAVNQDDGIALLRQMLEEVLSAHPESNFIHIGGDEVWHLAKGERSKVFMENRPDINPEKLYLSHMEKVYNMIKALRPNIKVLFWDDMVRNADLELHVNQFGFLRETIPVIWQYTKTLTFPEGMLHRYNQTFRCMFAASAFKGASSSCGQIPPIRMHVENHLSWRNLVQNVHDKPPFSGLIITGWQRFDHFAALCEMLPVGIPSLLCCVRAFNRGKFEQEDLLECSKDLGMSCLLSIDGFAMQDLMNSPSNFPGDKVFNVINAAVLLQSQFDTFLNSTQLQTWCSSWHVMKKKVSNLQCSHLSAYANSLMDQIQMLRGQLEICFRLVFPDCVFQEWFETNFGARMKRTQEVLHNITPYLK